MFFSGSGKRSIILACILTVFLVQAGCGAPQAKTPAEGPKTVQAGQSPEEYWAEVVAKGKAEGVVNIGTSLGQKDFLPFVIDAMDKLYGIKVESEALDDARNIAKMKAEQAAKNYHQDLVSLKLPYIVDNPTLIGDFGHIPELEKGKWAIDMKANSPGLVLLTQSFGVGVNTKMLPEGKQPASIKELSDPKYKGLIVLSDPSGLGGATEWVARLLLLYGEDWLKSFYANCVILPTEAAPAIRQKIVAGEYAVNPFDGWAALPFLEKNSGVPYKFYIPAEGTFSRPATVALVKNAPHPNAARLLVNWILSPEGQIAVSKAANTPLRVGTGPLPYPMLQDLTKMTFMKPFPDTLEFSTKKMQEAADLSKKIFKDLNIKVQG